MNIRHGIFFPFLLCATLANSAAWAGDTSPDLSARDGMTREQYEIYRARIQRQIEGGETTQEKQPEEKAKTEKGADRQSAAGGYGQGYRARQERSANRMNAGRSGVVNRAGGRSR
ncbi:MAG: hypothetical protein Q8O64_20285 [Sideroxyarcus sp.]|nr:hypothetical protein [Sideroxyarcus sp.]